MKGNKDGDILDLLSSRKSFERGFRLLVEQYQEVLYGHVRRMVDNHADADDVLQNTFIKVYRSIGNFKGNSSLYTWLYRIATNEALSLIRSRKSRNHRQVSLVEAGQSNEGLADAFMESEEIEKRLASAVKTLPEKQQEVFLRRYYEEMPYDDMSALLDTSVGALKASYHHAVKKVVAHLKNEINR